MPEVSGGTAVSDEVGAVWKVVDSRVKAVLGVVSVA